MFKPEEMLKIRVFCPTNRLKNIISTLYDSKAVDIIEHKKDELDIGEPLQENNDMSEALVKARSVLFQLGLEKLNDPDAKKLKYFRTQMREISNIHAEVNSLINQQKETNALQKLTLEYLSMLKRLDKLNVSADLFRDSDILEHYVGYVDELEKLEADLAQYKGYYELRYANDSGRILICLFIDKNLREEILVLLRDHSFTELRIDKKILENSSYSKLRNQLNKIRNTSKQIEKNLKSIKSRYGKELTEAENALSIAVKKSESPLMFAQTENISIISGWIPRKQKKKLYRNLEQVSSGKISIEELDIQSDDAVPIKLANALYAKSSEFFLRLFSMPSYSEIDPTLFIFFTFPLFYGLMLGDIGYGLVTLLLFIFLKKKMPDAKDLLNIMIIASISAMVFGGLMGEFFGYDVGEIVGAAHGAELSQEHGTESFGEWITTFPLHRSADNAINLIILTLIIGAIHVNFGLLLGFINVYRQHGLSHAIYEKFSWLLLEIGLPLAIIAMIGLVPGYMQYVGLGITIVAALMLFKGEGIQGLIELPSVFVHIGSYMRLMAIGLASVSLAVVVDEQTGPLFSSGIFGIIIGILIFTIGHVINIALGIIGPFLHSIRLHYVEHFTKFYSGGGKEFSPFGARLD